MAGARGDQVDVCSGVTMAEVPPLTTSGKRCAQVEGKTAPTDTLAIYDICQPAAVLGGGRARGCLGSACFEGGDQGVRPAADLVVLARAHRFGGTARRRRRSRVVNRNHSESSRIPMSNDTAGKPASSARSLTARTGATTTGPYFRPSPQSHRLDEHRRAVRHTYSPAWRANPPADVSGEVTQSMSVRSPTDRQV